MWRGGRRHISDALRRVLSSYSLKSCNFFSIFVIKRHFGVHTHVLKYRKHNGIIIPTLVLALQVKIQYGCHFKANIINNIRI